MKLPVVEFIPDEYNFTLKRPESSKSTYESDYENILYKSILFVY